MLISLAEYAQKHGRAADTVRQKALRGKFKTAQKIGRNWVIDSEEKYIDDRVTSGKYNNLTKCPEEGRRGAEKIDIKTKNDNGGLMRIDRSLLPSIDNEMFNLLENTLNDFIKAFNERDLNAMNYSQGYYYGIIIALDQLNIIDSKANDYLFQLIMNSI